VQDTKPFVEFGKRSPEFKPVVISSHWLKGR
jgi:hypothetical protein